VVYNSEVGGEPLLVAALSGSQRFRVAVSLALGIGAYGSHGARGIETVIIDEGFGSLDQQGMRDMIGELRNLKSILTRIVLVSHQEEFSSAFSCGYRVRLVDGASTVSHLDSNAAESLGADVVDTNVGEDVLEPVSAGIGG
jgi:exonuclease SbcC